MKNIYEKLKEYINFDLDLTRKIDRSEIGTCLNMFPQIAEIIDLLIGKIDEIVEQRNEAEELKAILQSSYEGIEAVDIHGRIKYVNPAFLKITQIPADQRLNQNIFDKNPDGLLAKVLKSGKPFNNITTQAPGSGKECIASATPVHYKGEMIGAVIVVSDISSTIRIVKELEKSKSVLATLYDKLGNAHYSFERMVGNSRALQTTIELAKVYSESTSTVLILGESGTGKEVFAQSIYNHSISKRGPFISLNCAAIPQHLLESELFGYEKGAFTGANQRRIGMFELANNGTIFLDEIGDLDYSMQGKLLRVLQENEFRRVGGNKVIRIDVRVIAATNRSLEVMIKEGTFREDLYYRLNVLPLRIPPLRERKEDIPALVEFFIRKYNLKLGKNIVGCEENAMEILADYKWPGNIRELENVVERAMNLTKRTIIGTKLISQLIFTEKTSNTVDENDLIPIAEMEKILIARSLEIFGTDLKGKKLAAKALGISLASLYNKIRK